MPDTVVGRKRFTLEPTVKIATAAILTGALHVVLYASERRMYDHLARRPAVLVWWLATAGLFLVYASVVNECRQPTRSRRFLAVLALTPLVLQVWWLFATPVLSIDLYSYVADSFSAQSGFNPYLHAPRDWAHTPLGAELQRYGWHPTHGVTPYGPLWMTFIVTLGHSGADVRLAMLIVKAALIACNAACAILIAGILGEIKPDAQLLGTVAFWWNPIALETAGEGHNDAAMAAAVLLALWLTVRKRQYTAGALSLTCAVLVKYVPVILIPAFLVHQWRAQGRGRLKGIALWGLSSALLCGLLFAPVWAGWQTFAGVSAGMHGKFTAGTPGALFAMLSHAAGEGPAAWTATLGSAGILLVAIGLLSRNANDGSGLVRTCATLCLVYVLAASPRFWPWYVVLPAALLCATGTRDALLLVVVLTFCARMIAPLNLMHRVNAIDWPTSVWLSTVVGVWIPAAWWTLSLARARQRSHVNPGSSPLREQTL